jgi:hypothetical protein
LRRVLTTVTLLGLLVATAAAFVVTEHLKLMKSPVFGPQVTRLISPVCGCATAKAEISVQLRHADRLTVTIVNADRQTVATLATNVREPKGEVSFPPWDGRTDAGIRVPDGSYRPQIELANARRTILLPPSDQIIVDTTTPKVLTAAVTHRDYFPSTGHTVAIRYAFSEPAHAAVFLNGRRIILGRATKARRKVNWTGKVDGRTVPAGRYVLSVGAIDPAGNATPASKRRNVVVVIRHIALARGRIRVAAGARFTVGVETGAASFTWQLARRHGTAKGKLLHLRAPAKRGRYRLVVSEDGHSASATVIVGRT